MSNPGYTPYGARYSDRIALAALFVFAFIVIIAAQFQQPEEFSQTPPAREEVVFWHFWGGADRDVVEDVARRFNASQDQYFVQPIAIPGNNLDAKLFLSVIDGDPPDLVNQDDPIIADWANRGALTPLNEVATPEELNDLNEFQFPAARRLTTYQDQYYGLCNGLDIRALYYNQTLFEQLELSPPQTTEQLDKLAEQAMAYNEAGEPVRFGYLPDSRRLWAWGVVFGGQFYDPQHNRPTADARPVVDALSWMQSYTKRYGVDQVAAFRAGDQSLPGKSFPLLPLGDDPASGRYAMILDGQWRTRDLAASNAARVAKGLPPIEYGVAPLPPPPNGRPDAGWVNGNFFIIPRGAKQPRGAWEFMKFWIGLDGNAAEAAKTCAAGGWIPVSGKVVEEPAFENFLNRQPLFREFVRLAASENQHPIPPIPGAALYNREIKGAGAKAMSDPDQSPQRLLSEVNQEVQGHLQFVGEK